jgi:hypothetical protein
MTAPCIFKKIDESLLHEIKTFTDFWPHTFDTSSPEQKIFYDKAEIFLDALRHCHVFANYSIIFLKQL